MNCGTSSVGLFIALTVFLTSCGDNKRKLSDEEKAHFYETIAAVGRIPSSVTQARGNEDTAEFDIPMGVLLSSSGTFLDPKTKEMAEHLRPLVLNRYCQIELVKSEAISSKKFSGSPQWQGAFIMPDVPEGVHTSKLEVSGSACPIRMNLALTIEAKGNISPVTGGNQSVKGTFVWDYTVTDETFKKLNEIDSVSLRGDFEMSAKLDGTNDGKFKISFNIDGDVHSVNQGNLGFYLDAEMRGEGSQRTRWAKLGSDLTFGVRFPEYTAELFGTSSLEANSNHSAGPAQIKLSQSFTLNGEELSQFEYSRYLGAGIPGNALAFTEATWREHR